MFKILFAVVAAIALVACNKAENLEPLLQGAWNSSVAMGWRQIRFSNGVIIVSQLQKPPLQGQYKLKDKILKLELYTIAGDKQVKQAVQNAIIEKLDGNSLELYLNGQKMGFTRDIP